ncbi:GNAT family N-acetyltransferase [Aliiroseovarius sp. F47248L]|uniref:GNAT family N-acetyltransferase n=1 Tax=Aliiroseovarius sp. F47248L TaxID=2926420 RepID=UPI001FF57F2E|nr:GNAT family N-acetyltransferase [Aliiroseovarius sp. F47248L]MCK0140393.1 GNAT family N-acetyltransferase [Aliiroseovarius sp. F47248L]
MKPHKISPDEDTAPILALLHRAFAGMEGRIDPPSSLHRLTNAGIAKQVRDGEVWVIGDTACVFLTPLPDATPPALYIGKLAVDPSARGLGLARTLMTLVERRAKALGFEQLVLQTRVELVENHAIFKKLGFVKTAEIVHPGYDRPTSYRFEKTLRGR